MNFLTKLIKATIFMKRLAAAAVVVWWW